MTAGDKVAVIGEHALADYGVILNPNADNPTVPNGTVGIYVGVCVQGPKEEPRAEVAEFHRVSFDIDGTQVIGVIHQANLRAAP